MLLTLIAQGQAQQLGFSKSKVENAYQFTYQWLDHTSSKHTMTFTLTNEGLFDRFRNFKSYQKNYAQKTIVRRIIKEMQKKSVAGVQVFYRQQHDKFYIEVKGVDEKKVADAYQALAVIETEVTQKYLKEAYYQIFTDHERNHYIKVDHASIANDSVTDLKPLKPLILKHQSIRNIRKLTNYVLGFVQSIPYSPLESRLTSSGAGFNPPLQVLWENQGDCDSKMALTAAILRALIPRLDMVLIYIDGHAFIGINLPSKAGDISIIHHRVRYVLGEPTGPALLPLGKLAPASELAIIQGHYTAQDYHNTVSKKST